MIDILVHSLLGKLIIGSIAVLGSLRYGVGLYAWRQTELLERPTYEVLKKLSNGVEIRRYEPYLIAETIVDGTGFREPTAQGFRACAGYIFGKNKSRRNKNPEKMAMTAPVRVEGSSTSSAAPAAEVVGEKMAMTAPVRVSGGFASKKKQQNSKVSFVIGSKYNLKTVPKPMDKNIKLRNVPQHTLAVRTFSGPPPKDERVKRERNKIEQSLSEANMQYPNDDDNDTTLVYGFHDPYVCPNFLRRNEVAVVIEGKV